MNFLSATRTVSPASISPFLRTSWFGCGGEGRGRVGSCSLPFDRLDGKNIQDDCLPTQKRLTLPSSWSGQDCGFAAQPSRKSFCLLLFLPSFLSTPWSPWYFPTKLSVSMSQHQFVLLAVKMPVFYRGLKQKRTVWLSPFDWERVCQAQTQSVLDKLWNHTFAWRQQSIVIKAKSWPSYRSGRDVRLSTHWMWAVPWTALYLSFFICQMGSLWWLQEKPCGKHFSLQMAHGTVLQKCELTWFFHHLSTEE